MKRWKTICISKLSISKFLGKITDIDGKASNFFFKKYMFLSLFVNLLVISYYQLLISSMKNVNVFHQFTHLFNKCILNIFCVVENIPDGELQR